MDKTDFAAFAKMLTLTAEQYGRALSPEMTRFYFEGCEHLPLEAVRTALNRWVRNTQTGQFMPKIADIIREATGGADEAAMRALRMVQDAFSSVGAYESVDFGDEAINATVVDMGGWPALCARKSEEWQQHGAREFMRRYRIYADRGVQCIAGALPGIAAADCVARGLPAPEPVRLGGKHKALTA